MSNKILLPQLVTKLAAETGVQKNVAETFIKNLFSTIGELLAEHEIVKVKDLGTFKVNRVEARKSVNVSTGEEIKIPPHYKITFVPSKNLAETVNKEFSWLDNEEISENVSNEELEKVAAPGDGTEVPELIVPAVKAQDGRNEEQEEQRSERLGEEIEKDFGDIEPVEPFGPIDPDDPEPGEPIPYNDILKEEEYTAIEDGDELEAEIIREEVIMANSSSPKKEFDPYADSGASAGDEYERGTEKMYLTKEEYDDLPKRNDIRAIGKHIKKLKGEIEDIDDDGKKRSLRYFLLGVVVSLALVTGGLFILYGILDHKGIVFANRTEEKVEEVTMAQDSPQRVDKTDDQQVTMKIAQQPGNAAEGEDKATDATDRQNKPQASQEEPAKVEEKGGAEAPTAPSDVKAMDKITNTRYLTTMAKEHYGNYNLWPYIYLENESKLGHPDRIKPGTPIVIPNISKYGVDPNNPKDIEKARKLGVEIYNKYSK